MTEFCIVRHGSCSYDDVVAKGFHGLGLELAPLNAAGIAQAHAAAKLKLLTGADVIISSPFTRALQTAAILSENLELDINVELDLRERDLDLSYSATDIDDLMQKSGLPGNAETDEHVAERVRAVLEKYRDHDKVIVVTHGGVINALMGLEHVDNCSVNMYKLG